MTQFQQFPPAPPQPHKKTMSKEARIGWSVLAGFAIFGLGAGIGAAGSGDTTAAVAGPQPAVTITVPVPDNGPTPDPVITPTNKPTPPPAVKPTKAAPKLTKSQEQAIGAAENYLEFAAFSRKGLIKQLSSEYGEGFSVKDATFAVDYLKVNWNEQAAKKAKEYLAMTHFSRQGLIRQLESDAGEGFTHKQAVYGVDKAGL